ncbi:COesterase and/or Abhydrolase 3 domain containing protein, partial [Asbolus verrucosus]
MSEPIVSVKQGKLLGKVSKNMKGEIFYCFQGIPYAKPPLGELRFKSPQPPEPWFGIRNAKKESNECFQKNLVLNSLIGSEDCLYLNVYTPQIPTKSSSPLKPVMFWIHGGGFMHGSSKSNFYGPEYLLTEDVVFVSINYRLGILGFLHFEDPSLGVPGNAGFKDMVMALKWVQDNIINFAGDPNNVTIFGQSAGAASVHLLVLSPITKGLFHKAIMQSGCALNMFIYTMTKEENLLAKEVENRIMLKNYTEKRPFALVLERLTEDAFLTEEPVKILCSGSYHKIPLIFGYNTREGMFFEPQPKLSKPKLPENFEEVVPFILGTEYGSEVSKTVANKIKTFYFGRPGSENSFNDFYVFHTDNCFLREIFCAIQYHVKTSSLPVYFYRVSVETNLNIWKRLNEITSPGVAHGDELGYLFKSNISPKLKSGSIEYISVMRFVKFWTSFAKYGDPNPNDNSNSVKWEPAKKDEFNFIDIGKQLITGVNPEHKPMEFWNEIFKVYNP